MMDLQECETERRGRRGTLTEWVRVRAGAVLEPAAQLLGRLGIHPNTLTIVDGIDCMEGDGPILGSLKSMGLVVVGHCLPAVDATVARIMGLEPTRVSYLALAARRLGPIAETLIHQRGERWQDVADPFEIIDEAHLQPLRARGARYS